VGSPRVLPSTQTLQFQTTGAENLSAPRAWLLKTTGWTYRPQETNGTSS
jgi:hypothetical protein